MTLDTTTTPRSEATTASSLLDEVMQRHEPVDRVLPFPTGFTPLDHVLGGGFHAQELVLLGGRPGVGKTVAALQWARWFAMHGRTAIYVCFEHSPETLLGRLFALEMGSLVRTDEVAALDDLRALARDVALGSGRYEELVADPLGEEAVGRVRAYGDRLQIVQASGKSTDVAEVEALARSRRDGPTALVVDYLQKVAVPDHTADEDIRSTIVVEALKDLAMSLEILVVAVVASDKSGITSRRLRLDHLRGSAALAHECDVALMLNEKSVAVSKRHLAFDPVRAETFRRKVVMSVEKNRGGPTGMDMEYTKDFACYRFDADGSFVGEALVDDVLLSE
jgi:replicative DNA helicase